MVVERERRWRAEVERKGRRDMAGAKLETENADLAKSLATSQWNLEVENGLVVCSTWYWVLNLLQLPFAFGVFGYECCKLYKESRDRKNAGNSESVCEASIEWSAPNLECIMWYIGRHCRGSTRFWWWIYTWSSFTRDWCHPRGG